MLKILLCSVVIVGIAVVLLSLRLILKGDTRGPMQHIGASKAMRKRGIHCVESMDTIERFEKANTPHAEERRKKKENVDK